MFEMIEADKKVEERGEGSFLTIDSLISAIPCSYSPIQIIKQPMKPVMPEALGFNCRAYSSDSSPAFLLL